MRSLIVGVGAAAAIIGGLYVYRNTRATTPAAAKAPTGIGAIPLIGNLIPPTLAAGLGAALPAAAHALDQPSVPRPALPVPQTQAAPSDDDDDDYSGDDSEPDVSDDEDF